MDEYDVGSCTFKIFHFVARRLHVAASYFQIIWQEQACKILQN